MEANKTVNISITELEDAVSISIQQEGKIPASLTVPPQEAITLATTIIRIANRVRRQENHESSNNNS